MKAFIPCMMFMATLFALSCSHGDAGRSQGTTPERHQAAGSGKPDTGNGTPDRTDPYVADSLAYLRWGHPNSPYRDDMKYLEFLDNLLARDSLPEELRLRAEERRRTVLLNRPGTTANDFSFEERGGERLTLHSLKGKKMLLIFYDPLCPHCSDILKTIKEDPRINREAARGALTVLAVYAEGKREVWEKNKVDFPESWKVGFDLTGILDRDLYDLPAMPTIYLLDADHTVIAKDPPAASILSR